MDESISNNDKKVPKKIAVVLEHLVASSRYGWWWSNRALKEKKAASITFFHSTDGGFKAGKSTLNYLNHHRDGKLSKIWCFSVLLKSFSNCVTSFKREPLVERVSEKWHPLIFDPSVGMVSNSNPRYGALVSPGHFVMAYILNILWIVPNNEKG